MEHEHTDADMQEFLDLLKTQSTITNQVIECIDIKKTKKGDLYREFKGEFNNRRIQIIIEEPFDKQRVPKELLFKECLLTLKLMPQTVLQRYLSVKAKITQTVLEEVQDGSEDEDALLEEAEGVLDDMESENEDAEDDVTEEGEEGEDAAEEEMAFEDSPNAPVKEEPETPEETAEEVPEEEPEKTPKPKRSRAKKPTQPTLFDTPHL